MVAGRGADCLTAAATSLLDTYASQDIHLLDCREGDAVRKVIALPSPDFSPMFSPDGRELAFMSWVGKPDFFYSNVHLATVNIARVWDYPATVAADVHDVTSAFDETAFLRGWSGDTLY